MSITIYEKTPSGLYATGDRTVSTFPSGLVRVEQTFVCKTSAAATHRAALTVGTNMPGGSAPAIDGLKIFPEPQEKQRGDGFTEFIVSAYGRKSINGTYSTFYELTPHTKPGYRFKTRKILQRFVIQSQEISHKTPQEDSFLEEIILENPDAELLITGDGYKVYTEPYVWYSIKISFTGTGGIYFKTRTVNTNGTIGDFVPIATINGTGDNTLTSQFFSLSIGNKSTQWYIEPFGNVSNLKANQFENLSYSQIIKSQWLNSGTEITNYGFFSEVVKNYISIPWYLTLK